MEVRFSLSRLTSHLNWIKQIIMPVFEARILIKSNPVFESWPINGLTVDNLISHSSNFYLTAGQRRLNPTDAHSGFN